MEWSSRLPELGAQLKDKMHVFDRPLALWRELQVMVGGSEGLPSFQKPKFEWVQPTLDFLSPTFTEFLLFFVTLILFIASWRDLRRAMIMTFSARDARLRTLRILNEIEVHLGNYLLTVTLINVGVGVGTGLICALTGMPNPAGLGALVSPPQHACLALPAPGGTDQEADAERQADGRERPLCDRVFEGLLDRSVGVLCRAHHCAAALRHVVDRGIHVLARLAIAAAGLLARGIGKGVERVGDLVGEGGDIAFHGCYILLKAFAGGFVGPVSHPGFGFGRGHQGLRTVDG
jgi:hypothetical protein